MGNSIRILGRLEGIGFGPAANRPMRLVGGNGAISFFGTIFPVGFLCGSSFMALGEYFV
jgi:hypothetical protein